MSDLSDYTKSVGTTLGVDVDGQHKAALTVVSHAIGTEDGRMLLDMLGLLDAAKQRSRMKRRARTRRPGRRKA